VAHYRNRFAQDRMVDRADLRRSLDSTLESPLSVIVAPAGAGKTTLLQQWCTAHPDADVAFFDIGPGDDDPQHFRQRLLDGLDGLDGRDGRDGRDGEVSDESRGTGAGERWCDPVVASLERLSETVIVIDNMHRFTNVDLVVALGQLIVHAPPTAHFVLSSRTDPPFSLTRYRLENDLLELRQDDLAFTLTEATELLERLAGRALPRPHVHTLWTRTEGWAAGLQLAGLSLRTQSDPEAFVTAFGGSDRLVAEYLSEEVLDGLSADQRHTLLSLAVLDDMCADLVEETTGSANGKLLLDTLERDAMFLVPLDGTREWFRFHHLFSDLLRARVRAENPALELRVLTEAADWNLARGRVRAAMGYLLRAQARDGALEALLVDVAGAALAGPPLRSPPALGATADPGPARLEADVLAGARRVILESASPTPEHPRAGLGYVAAQVLWRARPEVSPEVARRRLSELEAELGGTAPNAISTAEAAELTDVLVSGGRANFLAGNITEARKWLARARATASSDVVDRIAATSALSLVEAWSGNTARANELVSETVETARASEMLALPSISDAYLASVLTALDSGDGVRAASPAPPDVARGRSGAPGHVVSRSAPSRDIPPAGRIGAGPRVSPTVLFERAIAALSLGDTYPVRKIVSAWPQLVPSPRPLAVVQFHILQAWLADHDHAPDEVQRHLSEALRVAEIHSMVDVFVRAGPTILHRLASVPGPQSAFSERIAARARQAARPAATMVLAEPLTDRELEILSYLPTRLSNVELARRFFVSVNTIKTHIAHIYRKLDVPDRNTAIVRARDLGLL
jgi:LuxR family maltose regulon positive regulatory protein